MNIGILGAGFISRAFAANALRHGHDVMLSNSRGPRTLGSAAAALRCRTGFMADAIAFGDMVVLALPLAAYAEIPAGPLAGKIVIDIMNHYPDRDGPIAALEGRTTSELVAQHLPGARVVKAFNAIMANDLAAAATPAGLPAPRALPIAGDDAEAKAQVAALIEQFGFEVVDAGPLAEGWRFERARPAYCVPLDRNSLARTLAATGRDDFVTEYSWRKSAT